MSLSGGGLKSARWLRSFKQGPMVTGFHNIESGQVVFSQTILPQQYYLDRFFKHTNWQNRKPKTRKDFWRPLVVAELGSHEQAVNIFKNLLELREMRDSTEKLKARDWRRKSEDGNIWYSGQFRPTYTHEAIADLMSALSAADVKGKLHWDHMYRVGNLENWADVQADHTELPMHNPREQYAVLNRLRKAALLNSRQFEEEARIKFQAAAEAARAAGEPTAADLRQLAREERIKEYSDRVESREARRAQLRDAHPMIKAIDEKEEVMKLALEKFQAATKERKLLRHHPELTLQEKTKVRVVYKMRRTASRRAVRDFRAAKRAWKTRNKKGQVVQSKVRLGMRLH